MASISVKNLAQAIYESSLDKEGKDLDIVLKKSISLIKNKNLMSKKNEILKKLEDIINKENGIIQIKVSSREKLKENIEKEIEDFIKHKYKASKVVTEKKENSKLLGGIKIEIGDDIIDTTLSNKIHQLQDYLIKN